MASVWMVCWLDTEDHDTGNGSKHFEDVKVCVSRDVAVQMAEALAAKKLVDDPWNKEHWAKANWGWQGNSYSNASLDYCGYVLVEQAVNETPQ